MASKPSAQKVPVALPKGNEGPGSANAGAGAASLVPLDGALSGAVGARIRVTTTSNTTVEGTLYTADPLTSLLILNTSPTKAAAGSSTTISPSTLVAPSGAYRIIPLAQIQNFQLLSPGPSSTAQDNSTTSTAAAQQLDTASLQARLQSGVSAQQSAQARQGPRGTLPLDQALYDALSRTHPARWEGNKMVISDAFVIEKPYQGANVGYYHGPQAGEGGNGQEGRNGGFKGDLDRFRKVVDMELSKAKLRLGKGGLDKRVSTSGAAGGGAERKGG